MEEPMDVTKCNAFLVAVDTGSMTAAAERLGYTQSGVTRMIRSLEEEIGFSLLVRTKKGVVMTENGKNMLAVFRDIVRVHENAEQRSAEIRGVISGTDCSWPPIFIQTDVSLLKTGSRHIQW
jgi:DNA-binding transcriptional LysR family regulator